MGGNHGETHRGKDPTSLCEKPETLSENRLSPPEEGINHGQTKNDRIDQQTRREKPHRGSGVSLDSIHPSPGICIRPRFPKPKICSIFVDDIPYTIYECPFTPKTR